MASSSSPIPVPPYRSVWAVPLSVLAHAGLVAALFLSVAWKSEPPAQLQAELWEAMPTTPTNAPPVVEPVLPTTAVTAEPEPVKPVVGKTPEPEAIAPTVEKKVVKKPVVEADPEPAKKTKPTPKVEPKSEKKQEKKQEIKVEAKPDTTARDAARAKEIARMNQLSQSAGLGGAPVVGVPQAGSAQGLGAGWGAKLKACVQPNLRYSDASGANPRVELLVKLSPAGTPVDIAIAKPSGNAAYDSAVERAVRRCDPFPKPESGPYPASLTVAYRLND